MKNLKKEFAGLFYSMSVTRGRAEVWRDIVFLWAAAINNRVHYKQKIEDAYLAIIQKYTRDEQERIAEMLAIVAADMARDPEQDFLGGFYMAEQLGNPRRGQYFTPYDVADMMSRITLGTVGAEITQKGYITVNDPACGSGVMLLAGANCLRRQKIGVESNVLFVGQDIETGIGLMAYVQLSLAGCPGYVVIGDSLSEPLTGNVLKAPDNAWVTPAYHAFIFKHVLGGTDYVDRIRPGQYSRAECCEAGSIDAGVRG